MRKIEIDPENIAATFKSELEAIIQLTINETLALTGDTFSRRIKETYYLQGNEIGVRIDYIGVNYLGKESEYSAETTTILSDPSDMLKQ